MKSKIKKKLSEIKIFDKRWVCEKYFPRVKCLCEILSIANY